MQSMERSKNIIVRDSLFDPSSGRQDKLGYNKVEDKYFYKVWLYLEGTDLPYVDYVIYHLHPTFPNPDMTVRRTIANPNCSQAIWSWGMFNVNAEIFLKSGEVIRIDHYLTFDKIITNNEATFVDLHNSFE